MVFNDNIRRLIAFHRNVTVLFDDTFLGKSEKEVYTNMIRFKGYIIGLIDKRREEMKSPEFKSKDDFLTLLLQDDLFKDNDTFIREECATFMLAASQTSSVALANTLFYLT
jgi:cytochrome P450